MTATLYVVATPIGNLGDMTARGIETLRTVDRIVAEDTRRTRQLLTHFGITGKPLDALHAHSTAGDVARVVETLQRGESVAVVTESTTSEVKSVFPMTRPSPGKCLITDATPAAAIPSIRCPARRATLSATGRARCCRSS